MDKNHYSVFSREKKILRDHLAIDRTSLANERTFLAYLRTALVFFVSGVSFLHFFNLSIFIIIGWIFIVSGIGVFIVGPIKYLKTKHLLQRIQKDGSE